MGSRVRISPAAVYEAELQKRLEMSTAEIGLSVRTTNCLEDRGIFTVAQLLNTKPEDLLKIANFGEKTLEEVYQALERLGFYRRSRLQALGISDRPTPFVPELSDSCVIQFRVVMDDSTTVPVFEQNKQEGVTG
ncbi:DNA-directed RNA polymerase alpha subunit domain [Thermogutta terrifontis]|jgi:DNA-directed RNA polymerase subunit alpha|uniref:DNA-directed RNA polymerase alpha subunit domain n=1 Tax=Thermogutta terrifontis TaxID=1331910 RepID=A0A286RKD0_9BACT|nr:DNA-directed RNA polymerase subunit alpha C-terminal domain-containing protein [Thermogutta terrifontis]ASV76421.1 DNA-directed RNA polymerase alpha subunit domain [Thermogutta terrifontis]